MPPPYLLYAFLMFLSTSTARPSGTPKKKVALIGKGLTFDSGGYNIKVLLNTLQYSVFSHVNSKFIDQRVLSVSPLTLNPFESRR